jgi:transcriptional regulator GlxA family with amidase domain
VTTTIAVAVFENAEELDFAGPWEILAAWAQTHPDDDIRVVLAGEATEPVRCAKGLRVVPEVSWTELGRPDVLVYPGGWGTRAELERPEVLDRLRSYHAGGTLMTSVCTGSLVYAAAGLLDGKPATTHWGSLEKLGALGTDVEVRPDDRFVDTGSVVTAAGVSAGIDMALHLVRRLHSTERAREVRQYVQYDPEPPV